MCCGHYTTVLPGAGSLTFKQLLLRIKGVVQGAMANTDVPFARIVDAAGIPRSSAYTPVFQNMLSLQTDMAADTAADDHEGMVGLKTEPLQVRATHRSLHSLCMVTTCCLLSRCTNASVATEQQLTVLCAWGPV